MAEGAVMDSDQRLFEEWQRARQVIETLASNLDSLRKYGFSLITAIIAADSVISQINLQANDKPLLIVTPLSKVAIVISTMVLVVALYTIDRFYRALQYGAEKRAMEIEDALHMGLTREIRVCYDLEKAGDFVDFLYGGFMLAAAILGTALVLQDGLLILLIWVALAAAWVSIIVVHLIWVYEKKKYASKMHFIWHYKKKDAAKKN